MLFCRLECDEKTLGYLLRYIDYIIKDEKRNIHNLDNIIQYEEMQLHLKVNNISEDKSNNAILVWSENHAEKFRAYLNSMKELFYSFESILLFNPDLVLNQEIFEKLVKNYNRWYDSCLKRIY